MMEYVKDTLILCEGETYEIVNSKDGRAICVMYIQDKNDTRKTAKRLVSCYNACAGIPNDVLEAKGYLLLDLLKSRDEQIALKHEAENHVDKLNSYIKQLEAQVKELEASQRE